VALQQLCCQIGWDKGLECTITQFQNLLQSPWPSIERIHKARGRGLCISNSVFFSGDQASAVASGGWPRWGIFGGNWELLPLATKVA
jgi:hypothetical protein